MCWSRIFFLAPKFCTKFQGFKTGQITLSDMPALASAVSGRRRVLICLREEQSASILTTTSSSFWWGAWRIVLPLSLTWSRRGAKKSCCCKKMSQVQPKEHTACYVASPRDPVVLSSWHTSILWTSNLKEYATVKLVWIVWLPPIFAQNLGDSFGICV